MLKKIILAVFPANTRRGRYVKSIAVKLGLAKDFIYNVDYQVWIDTAEQALFLPVVKDGKPRKKPLFSIVVPTYNTPQKYLGPLIESIMGQSYGSWELILSDDSKDEERAAAIMSLTELDDRIKYVEHEKGLGISENTNKGIEIAVGEYIVFTDHDDVLVPTALNELAAEIYANPNVDILYSDEDKLTDDGRYRFWPHFKSNWSPHQFLTCNYTNHISAVKTSLVNKVGGLRADHNGAQDYDLLLRIHGSSKKPLRVIHIPKVLYHWRLAEGSTAADFSLKDYALQAGIDAVEGFLKARGLDVSVAPIEDRPGFYNPNIQPARGRKVIVMVDAGDDISGQGLVSTLESITDTDAFSSVQFMTSPIFMKTEPLANLANDDVIVKIKANIIPNETDWLQRLAGALELDDILAVAPRILGHDGRIWDMGLLKSHNGSGYDPLFQGRNHNDDSMYGHTEWIRDVDALTTSFMAVRIVDKELLDEQIIVAADSDPRFCTIWSPVQATYYGDFAITSQANPRIFTDEKKVYTPIWKK